MQVRIIKLHLGPLQPEGKLKFKRGQNWHWGTNFSCQGLNSEKRHIFVEIFFKNTFGVWIWPDADRCSSRPHQEPMGSARARSRCLASHQGFSPENKFLFQFLFILDDNTDDSDTYSQAILGGWDGVEFSIVVEPSHGTHLEKHMKKKHENLKF